MPKPVCNVMVGLPGLGKSTALSQTVDNPEFGETVFVYSTDNYIQENADALGKTYDEVFQDYIGKATTRMNQLLDIAIQERVDIFWDQTNLGVGKRRKIINRMKKSGYEVRCFCFLPPDPTHISDQKEWNYRLKNREGKTIPGHILTNMINSFTVPTVEEGFSCVMFFNMYGQLLNIVNHNGLEN